MLIYDSTGKERHRIEGYLPRDEFRAQLEVGLARVNFMHKKFKEAEQQYRAIVERWPETTSVPEAIYWAGVCHYKATNDHTILAEIPGLLAAYEVSIWSKKASVWEKSGVGAV